MKEFYTQAMNTDQFADLARTLATHFIGHPEDLKVECRQFSHSYYITMQPHRADMSKLIGSAAKTVKALTMLLVVAARRRGQMISFEILEPVHGIKGKEPPFAPDQEWTPEKEAALKSKFDDVLQAVFITDYKLLAHPQPDQSIFVIATPVVDVGVQSALNVILRAIGKSHNRRVSITFNGEVHNNSV